MRGPVRGRVAVAVALLAVVAAGASPAVAQSTTDDPLGCSGSEDGAVFVTDGGLAVTHDGRALTTSPYVNDTTLSFPNVTVSADGNASVVVASATESRVCVTDLAPTDTAVGLAPAAGPRVVVADPLDGLAYGAVDYAPAAGGADLAYSAPAPAAVELRAVPLDPGRTVRAVADGTVVDAAVVTDGRTAALELPAGTRTVDLRVDPVGTPTATPATAGADGTGPGDATGPGDGTGPGTGTTTTDPPAGSGGPPVVELPPWTGELFDYQPSPQTRHVGAFLPLAVLLWLLATWLLVARDGSEATLLALVLVVAAVRATSDLLEVVVDGFVGPAASVAGLNVLLELSLAVLFVQFAAAYADEERLRTRRAKLGLAALAALGAATVVTNPLHGLVFIHAAVATGPFTYVTASYGPVGWALFAADLALVAAGGWLLLRSFRAGSARGLWRPAAVVASGLALALGVGAVDALGLAPVAGFDYTAAGVNYFLLATTVALARYGLARLETTGKRSVVADLDDPVLILDDAWRVVEWNPAAARVFPAVGAGRPFDALLEVPLERPTPGEPTTTRVSLPVDAVPADDQVRAADGGEGRPRAEDAAVGADSADGQTTDEPSADGSDGTGGEAGDEYRHFVASARAVTTERTDVVGYVVRLADVTHLERQVTALAARRDRLDQFASAITRDLRSPLAEAETHTGRAVDALTTATGPDDVDRSRLAASLSAVDAALERIATTIEDILALARGDPLEADLAAVAFGEIVESVWESVDGDDATVRVETDGTLTADPTHLRRLLEALLRNAVEHGSGTARSDARDDAGTADDASVTVRVGLTADGFYVADDGPGVPPADRERVFEHGYSTKDRGPGLGLAIATQRAAAHGWELRLDPDAEGARFVVTGAEAAPDDDAGGEP